jgi:hypothetical protein
MPRLLASAHFTSDPDPEGFSRTDYSRIGRVHVHQDSSVPPKNGARYGLIGLNLLKSIQHHFPLCDGFRFHIGHTTWLWQAPGSTSEA